MYDSFLQQLIQLNTLPVGIVLFLAIFIRINDDYERELSHRFLPPLCMLVALIFIDNLDYYYISDQSVSVLHVLVAVLGYDLRIFLLTSLIFIVLRDEKLKNRRLIYIPAVINFLVCITPFFSHIMFWYEEGGELMRGPLSYTPHVMSFILACILLGYGLHILRYGRWAESLIICAAVLLAIIATAFETIFALRGLLIGVVAMDVTFFYLYIHIEYFKLDILTGALNRVSFYADTQKISQSAELSVFSIDLNNLKVINDTKGHQAGDTAIRETAKLILKNLPRGGRLYRIGGDEFVIICVGVSDYDLEKMLLRMREDMAGSVYSFSIGRADRKDNEDFETLYRLADRNMYENKRSFKLTGR